MKKKNKYLTVRKKRDSLVNSEYGIIRYDDWCNKEVKRIGRGCTYEETKTHCWVQRKKDK